ncbi:MAG: galactokinase family protein [Proteocatella sp.]
MNIKDLKNMLTNKELDKSLKRLYSSDPHIIELQRKRYLRLIGMFEAAFKSTENASFFSAPGRTELGGNHTDHQRGQVIAASINLDMIACCSSNDSNIIRIKSEGFDQDEIDLSENEPKPEEINTSAALIRGIASKIKTMGYALHGFDAYITSDVLTGSGLSSSAAFEVLIGVIINHMFCNGEISAIEIAKIGQYAENVYFGKPCGLMDQMASSVGNIIEIDFRYEESPVVEKVDFDFTSTSYALCIIDTGGDHADLTDEYAAIPKEMKNVAAFFGKEVLSQVDETDFYKNISKIRKSAGDRAVLRAAHYFADTKRAVHQTQALKAGNWNEFLNISNESGHSSFEYLQNIYVSSHPETQNVSVTLAICKHLLGEKGACRVHGGGFAGTVQAFVPLDMLERFKVSMEESLGSGSCHILSIRSYGGVNLLNLKK